MQEGGSPNIGINDMRKKIEHYSYGLNDKIFIGNYCSIYRGVNQKNLQPVSIKVINIKSLESKQGKHSLQNQIEALKALSYGNNILKVYDILQTVNNCYIITEFCNEGDLDNFLSKRGKIDEKQAIPIFRDIVNGFKVIIQSKFLHRDLRPVNILIKDKIAKIGDFSYAKKQASSPFEKDNIGTPAYMSPQALTQNIFTIKNDIWALGCILYQMLHGQLPWPMHGNNKQQQVNQIKTNPLDIDRKLSEDLRDFIKKCLVFDQMQRLNGVDFFHHPFIVRISQPTYIINAIRKNAIDQLNKDLKNKQIGSNKLIKENQSIQGNQLMYKKNINTKQKTQKQFQAQINYMRYIYRFLELFPSNQQANRWSIGLKFLATKQMLSLLYSLKKSIFEHEDHFNFLAWSEFMTNNQKQLKHYKQILSQYQTRYDKIKTQHETILLPLASKDRSLSSVTNTNYARSQLLSILSIKYSLEQCRHLWTELCKKKQKLSEQQYRVFFARQALKLDYTITFYQLNCYLIDNFNDPDYFCRNSKIDVIIQYKPSTLVPAMKGQFQEKMKLLEILY